MLFRFNSALFRYIIQKLFTATKWETMDSEQQPEENFKTVFFAGSRREDIENAREQALSCGFDVIDDFEDIETLDYLIRGKKAGKRQLDKALELGASIVNIEDFVILLGASTADQGLSLNEAAIADTPMVEDPSEPPAEVLPRYIDFSCNVCGCEYRTTDEYSMATYYCSCGNVLSTGNSPAAISNPRPIVIPANSRRDYRIRKAMRYSFLVVILAVASIIAGLVWNYSTQVSVTEFPYATTKSGTVFHRSDCPIIKRSKDVQYYRAEEYENLLKKYRPCKSCNPLPIQTDRSGTQNE